MTPKHILPNFLAVASCSLFSVAAFSQPIKMASPIIANQPPPMEVKSADSLSLLRAPLVRASRDGEFPHWEISLRADPQNATHLLASCVSENLPQTSPDRRTWTCATYASRDGGATWTSHNFAPRFLADPICAFGPSGAAYFVGLDIDAGAPIAFWSSPDGGATWGEAQILQAADSKPDHAMIAVDNTKGRFAGSIYIAAQYAAGHIQLLRSRDGGRTFTSVKIADWQYGFVNNMLVLRDGTLFVPLQSQNKIIIGADKRYGGSNSQNVGVTSSDGGETWSAPIAIGTLSNAANGTGGASNAVYAAGRWKNSERLYAAWSDRRDEVGRVQLCWSDDAGRSWSVPRVATPDWPRANAQGACSLAVNRDGMVGLQWLDFVGDEYHVFFAASTNGGATFSTPARVSEQSSKPPARFSRAPGADYLLMDASPDRAFHTVWPQVVDGNYQIFTRVVRSTNRITITPSLSNGVPNYVLPPARKGALPKR